MTTEVLERRQRRQSEAPMTWPTEGILSVARVDLLPPIVDVRRRQNRIVRGLSWGLFGLILLVALGGVGAALLAASAEAQLDAERTRTQLLLLEQGKYTELQDVRAQLLDHEYAEVAALYAEADWKRLMTELDTALPDDFSLTSETITVKGLGQSDAATDGPDLDAPGVIEIAFTADAARFDSPTPLLNALSRLTGYLSATVDSVAGDQEAGYVVSGVIQLGEDALGGTARADALDPEVLDPLHTQLEQVATGAVIAPPTDETSDLDAAVTGD